MIELVDNTSYYKYAQRLKGKYGNKQRSERYKKSLDGLNNRLETTEASKS